MAADKSELARAALEALDAIDLRARMRAKAYFATKGFRGRYGFPGSARSRSGWFKFVFVVWLMLLGASIAIAAPNAEHAAPIETEQPLQEKIPPGHIIPAPPHPTQPIVQPTTRHQYIVWATIALGLILVVRLLFVLVATPILAHRAIIEIRKARIFLQYGLFDRKTYTAEVHWIREVTWAQSVVQKLFGEATIALHLDTPQRTVAVLMLPGLVPLSETQGYVDKLSNAAQRLRQGQGRWFPGGFIN